MVRYEIKVHVRAIFRFFFERPLAYGGLFPLPFPILQLVLRGKKCTRKLTLKMTNQSHVYRLLTGL